MADAAWRKMFGDGEEQKQPQAKPSPAAEAPPKKKSPVVDCGCYGRMRGVRDRALSIEFRRLAPDEPWPAPEYAFLVTTWWLPKTGGIRLEFTNRMKVTIEGRNLRRLRELLAMHRVPWVQEEGKEEVPDPRTAAEPRVYAITVELPEDEEEGADEPEE
jgi:hypothetical protein